MNIYFDIFTNIIIHLDGVDLINFSLVNKRMFDYYQSKSFWISKVKRYFTKTLKFMAELDYNQPKDYYYNRLKNKNFLKVPEKFSYYLTTGKSFCVNTTRDRFGDWEFYLLVFNIKKFVGMGDQENTNIYKFDIQSNEYKGFEIFCTFYEKGIYCDVSSNQIIHHPSNQSDFEKHFICNERYTNYNII